MERNYRFMLIFDAKNCNPNGDPETGGLRMLRDGKCMVTKQCIGYKLKRYLYEQGVKILHYCPNDELIIDKLGGTEAVKDELGCKEKALEYLDVRLFGACDLAKPLCLKVTGAVTMEHAITVDNAKEKKLFINRGYKIALKENGENNGSGFGNVTMLLEYGLFTSYGGTNTRHATDNNLTDGDMEIFFEGLEHIFENDAANIRPVGSMNVRKIIVWTWEGNKQPVSDAKIKESVHIRLKDEIAIPANYEDYEILVDDCNENLMIKIIEI